MDASLEGQPRSTRADWLEDPGHGGPAQNEDSRVPAPAKIQAVARYATERGIKVVSREEFERHSGPHMTLAQYDRLLARPHTSTTSQSRGRAPRLAANTRSRGSRRRTLSRAGPDGDPDLDSESDVSPQLQDRWGDFKDRVRRSADGSFKVDMAEPGNSRERDWKILPCSLFRPRQVKGGEHPGLDRDDYVQAALIAYWRAFSTYRTGSIASFKTYAYDCIRNRQVDFFRATQR